MAVKNKPQEKARCSGLFSLYSNYALNISMRKLKETTSGSIAAVATPIGKPLTRGGSLLSGKKTSQKTPNTPKNIKESDVLTGPEDKNASGGLHGSDKIDTVKMDIPLVIRLMEYSKESATNDEELHSIAENLVKLSLNNKTLTMKDYDKIIDTKPDNRVDDSAVKSKLHVAEGFTADGYRYTSALVVVAENKKSMDQHIKTIKGAIVESVDTTLPNGKLKSILYLNESLTEAGISEFKKGDMVDHGTIGRCKILRTDDRNVYVIADNDGRTYKVQPSSLSALEAVTELSNATLGRYKAASSADSTAADAAGGKENIKRANKRYSGIIKATTKQFKNDAKKHEVAESDDPCWKGYEQIGMKKKRGKEVPNCVPKKKKD